MKKIALTALAVITVVVLVTPALMPSDQAQAAALPPLSCVTAEEFGWGHPGWNWFCAIELENNCCDPIGDPWY